MARYAYNGLHWRVLKRGDVRDTASSGAPTTVQDRMMVYDASWRLIHQEIDDGADPAHDWGYGGWAPDRAEQLFWGNRYIDDAVARQQSDSISDAETETPTITWNTPQFYLTDAQFSVVAMLDPSLGLGFDVLERVKYDPYGRATHVQRGDFNGDGMTTVGDLTTDFLTAYFGGVLVADVNRSGGVTVQDIFDYQAMYFTPGHDAPEDQVSSPSTTDGNDNCVGYCGYIHNVETGDYTVRFRTYITRLGRWGERDPAGYSGGINLYGYVGGSVTEFTDPMGLEPTVGACSGVGGGKPVYDPYVSNYLYEILKDLFRCDGRYSSVSDTTADLFSKYSILRLDSKAKLDKEAKGRAKDFGNICGDGAKKTVEVVMVAPRTNTMPCDVFERPNSGSRDGGPTHEHGCCNIAITTIFDPSDWVPNQELFRDKANLWYDFGCAHAISNRDNPYDEPGNHGFRGFFREGLCRYRRMTPAERSQNEDEMGRCWPWIKTGVTNSEWNLRDVIRDAYNRAGDDGYLFICHSQGCNMLMSKLGEMCKCETK